MANCSKVNCPELNKESLVIKQGFKFLNPLCFRCQDEIVLPARHSNQVRGSIVCSDAVQVVHNPALSKRCPSFSLPDQKVFLDIVVALTRMIRLINHPISAARKDSTTFPIWMFITQAFRMRVTLHYFTSMRCIAWAASHCSRTNQIPTVTTRVPVDVSSVHAVVSNFIFFTVPAVHGSIIQRLTSRCQVGNEHGQ